MKRVKQMERDSNLLGDCPGYGLKRLKQRTSLVHNYNASKECYEKYSELTAYALSHSGNDFVHQHVVDAYAAQHSGDSMKNITTTFALIGLYFAVDHGYSGKQVQRVHTLLARWRHLWDPVPLPQKSYSVSVIDVLQESPGNSRDTVIREWMIDVWQCWSHQHDWVKDICHAALH